MQWSFLKVRLGDTYNNYLIIMVIIPPAYVYNKQICMLRKYTNTNTSIFITLLLIYIYIYIYIYHNIILNKYSIGSNMFLKILRKTFDKLLYTYIYIYIYDIIKYNHS